MAGDLKPRRIREFSTILQTHLPKSMTGTGSVSLSFTPDSSKLVLATAISSFVLIVELTNQKPQVLCRFDHHRRGRIPGGDRVVKGLRNGMDVSVTEDDGDVSDEAPVSANILRMAISPDGQWLATSDDRCRTNIFNMDLLKVFYSPFTVDIVVLISWQLSITLSFPPSVCRRKPLALVPRFETFWSWHFPITVCRYMMSSNGSSRNGRSRSVKTSCRDLASCMTRSWVWLLAQQGLPVLLCCGGLHGCVDYHLRLRRLRANIG
jgi:hypothetical protein